MMIGDTLFNRLAIRGFSDIGRDLAASQSRISSGVNDPRVSADPSGAMELSGLRDMRAKVASRDAQATRAANRLDLTDGRLAGLGDDLRQLKEITLRAATDTMTPEAHAALRTEAIALRDSLLATANANDAQGRPLFAGSAPGPAFVEEGRKIVYKGDDARLTAQLGDRLQVETGLPGSAVFEDVFDTVDRVIATLTEPMLSARASLNFVSPAALELRAGPAVQVTLTGPDGAAQIDIGPAAGPAAALAAINAATPQTGVQAAIDPTDGRLMLTASGPMTLDGQTGGVIETPLLWVSAMDKPLQGLRPAGQSQAALIEQADAVLSRAGNTRAAVGSLGTTVARALETLATERLSLDQAVAGLEDLDIAATVTRLQELLLTQEAAQQSYVKIQGQSLFDFIR